MKSPPLIILDLTVGAVGMLAGLTVSDMTALCTAASAGFYLACKGLVIIIREIRKKK